MFTLSAFADEISPDPQEQIDVLARCGVKHIELRSILKTNVLDLTDLQVRELKALLDKHGFRLSAIGSPVGKDEFDPTRPVPNMAKRPGQPQEAAKAVLFLASEDSSFVYGANLFVDGGVSAMDLS